MNMCHLVIASVTIFSFVRICQAEVKVSVDRNPEGSRFAFKSVPAPAKNDAAAKAQLTLVDGDRDQNGGPLAALQDGQLPTGEDQPSANFFFRAGTEGGRLQIDLGNTVSVKQVNTYSWHAGSRGPQVYRLYASDGAAAAFSATPKKGTDLVLCGWKKIADVDTRPKGEEDGGQYAASVSDSTSGSLGRYRYLLFDMARTEDRDAFGNTFYSEIDVIDADGPALVPAISENIEPIVKSFEADGGKYRFTVELTQAPDLAEWADTKMRPVVQQWYPKLVAMLPSEGFQAMTNLTFRFRNDMGGVPASAGGGRINLNSDWFRRELKREALGSVVHEMVHVVQSYGRARRGGTRMPGWLVEGIADYIRWFLYEPETKGAEITERNLARAKYDASYRVTGNFLNWVTLNHDKEIVRKLNAVAREGKYAESLWRDWTSKTLPELGEAWKKANEERISAAKSKTDPKPTAGSAQ